MRITGREKLLAAMRKHPACRPWIEAWVAEVEAASWRQPQDIKDRFASASFLAERRVVFNIKGNNYRMVVQVTYSAGLVVVEWVGTHAEYSKLY